MNSLALLTHRRAEDLLAGSDDEPITAGKYLADVRQLAAALPSGGYVLNACGNRYRFAVGMAAALLANKISLLPPTLTPEMVRQLQIFAPDVFCLTDQPQSVDMPQFAWADGVPAGATTPVMLLTSNPGSASATVPISGLLTARSAEVIAIGFMRPAFTCAMVAYIGSRISGTRPAITSG